MPLLLLFLSFALINVSYSQGLKLETSVQCSANIISSQRPDVTIKKSCDLVPDGIGGRPEIKRGCQMFRTSAATGPLAILFYESGEGSQRKIISELYLWSSKPTEILEVTAEEDGFFYQLKSRFNFKNGSVATCASGIKAHSAKTKKTKAKINNSDRGSVKETSENPSKDVGTDSKATSQ